MKKKGQISIEFLLVIIVSLVILGFSFFIYTEKNFELITTQERLEAKLLANQLARNINEIYNSGNGASIELNVQSKFGFEYILAVKGNSVRVEYGEFYTDAPLITQNTSDFVGVEGLLNIENQFGRIVVSNV